MRNVITEIPNAVGKKGNRKQKLPYHSSRFRILVNTNIHFTDEVLRDKAMAALRDATVNLPHNYDEYNLLKYFYWDEATKKIYPVEDKRSHLIVGNIITFVFEEGLEHGYLHEHIDLQINHNTTIQINGSNLIKYFQLYLERAGINAPSLFVRVKRVKADMTTAYMSKSQPLKETFENGGFVSTDTQKALIKGDYKAVDEGIFEVHSQLE